VRYSNRGMKRRGLVATAVLIAASQPAAASETRGYVVSWWFVATHTVADGSDCPNGINPRTTEAFARVLKEQGYPQAEIEKRVIEAAEKGQGGGGYHQIMSTRGRDKDGKPVNTYENPERVADPKIKLSQAKVAYGFNLDGKVSSEDFTDPETGEKGIDNQYYRALGCLDTYRATVGVSRPAIPEFKWDVTREHAPAWLIEISGIDDYQNDDQVEVSWHLATTAAIKDASSGVRRDMTMMVDAGSRMKVRLPAKIQDGWLLTDQVDELKLISDPYFGPGYDFKRARVRIKFNEDGSIRGILGGYLDYLKAYWGEGGSYGSTWEYFMGGDLPGLYYAMKKSADADPDSNGQNKSISSTWWFEGVPAFVTHPNRAEAQLSDARKSP